MESPASVAVPRDVCPAEPRIQPVALFMNVGKKRTERSGKGRLDHHVGRLLGYPRALLSRWSQVVLGKRVALNIRV